MPQTPVARWRTVYLVANYCLNEECLGAWKQFMDSNEEHFRRLPVSLDDVEEGKMPQDADEYTLQQSEVHAAFEDLVQRQIGEYLSTLGESMVSFFDLLKAGHDAEGGKEDDASPEVRAQCDVFAQLLLGCVEFRAFSDIMRDKNKRTYYFQILGMWRKTLK